MLRSKNTNISHPLDNVKSNPEPKRQKRYGLLDGPDPDVSRVVRVTLYHLDGSQSYMIMQMPNFTHWHHVHAKAAETINEYIFFLSKDWIQISKFHTEIGVLRNGVFKPCPIPHASTLPIDIPLNKVFIPGTQGTWVTIEEAQQLKDRSQIDVLKGGGNDQ